MVKGSDHLGDNNEKLTANDWGREREPEGGRARGRESQTTIPGLPVRKRTGQHRQLVFSWESPVVFSFDRSWISSGSNIKLLTNWDIPCKYMKTVFSLGNLRLVRIQLVIWFWGSALCTAISTNAILQHFVCVCLLLEKTNLIHINYSVKLSVWNSDSPYMHKKSSTTCWVPTSAWHCSVYYIHYLTELGDII